MKHSPSLQFCVYCRKSSEDNRQAASIGDQLRELLALTSRESLTIAAEPFKEERSAKAPGRPVFNEMLDLIERGNVNAILCWDIDRLYRNPVDEGRVRWLLQRGIIQQIRTPYRVFLPHDAGLLMGVEGGRATDHIITLQKGVFRGFRGKLDAGWRPGVAPPGYLNDTSRDKGQRSIVRDPERFELIQRAWRLMITGHYSVRNIHRIATEDWGLTSRRTEKRGGKPYTISTWYHVFTDPFYTGYFWFRVPEDEGRRLYKGSHEPMITQEQFDVVQFLLGRDGKRAPQTQLFAYTGMIRCGACAAMITAERKYHIVCSVCKHKFSAPNKDACPACSVSVDQMAAPIRRLYSYYHCTKRGIPRCAQKCIRAERLEEQIYELLGQLTISAEFVEWSVEALRDQRRNEDHVQLTAEASLDRRLQALRRQLAHINAMIFSVDTDWTLFSPEEVREQKQVLLRQLKQVEEQCDVGHQRERAGVALTERTFRFAAYAAFWLRAGDADRKRAILHGLGSNLALMNGKLSLEVNKPLKEIFEMKKSAPFISEGFEPTSGATSMRNSRNKFLGIPVLSRGLNAVRTFWEENVDVPPLADLPRPPSLAA